MRVVLAHRRRRFCAVSVAVGPCGSSPISPTAPTSAASIMTAFREANLRLEKNNDDAAAMTLLGELYNQGLGVAVRPEEGRRMVSAGRAARRRHMRSRPSA